MPKGGNMKKIFLLTVLLFSSLHAQWDWDAERSILIVNEWQWAVTPLQFLKPWDKSETYSFINYKDSLHVFKMKGGSVSLGGKWMGEGTSFKNVSYPTPPDFVTLEARHISASNLVTKSLVNFQIQSKDWAISPATKESNPLDGSKVLYTWDLRSSKEKLSTGIKRVYILPKAYVSDSCEIDLTVGVRNLTFIYADGRKEIIDFFDFTKTGIQEPQVVIPTEFVLYQNYPNPFNPSTTIEFAVPVSGNYALKVYDVLGQEIASLIDKDLNAGTHKVSFDASKLTSGIYIYRLTGENISLSKKMMYAK